VCREFGICPLSHIAVRQGEQDGRRKAMGSDYVQIAKTLRDNAHLLVRAHPDAIPSFSDLGKAVDADGSQALVAFDQRAAGKGQVTVRAPGEGRSQ